MSGLPAGLWQSSGTAREMDGSCAVTREMDGSCAVTQEENGGTEQLVTDRHLGTSKDTYKFVWID